MIYITEYNEELKHNVIEFFHVCMPESGRTFEPSGRHSQITEIGKYFKKCWCLIDNGQVIGTAAVKELDSEKCELKIMYVLKKFQGMGYGRKLLDAALLYAEKSEYKYIFLDTKAESTRAIDLYKKYGFTETERYNDNLNADIFMRKELNKYKVNEAEENDLDELLLLYTQLHDNPIPEKSDYLLDLWQNIMKDPNHHIVVCKKDGRIISSCVIMIIRNLTHSQCPYALIENVITDELHRKKGLASACLDYAKKIAQKENCYKIMLMTGSKLESTMRFYEKLGYNRHDKTAFIQWL